MGGENLLITREMDYALRILRALSGGERMPASEICERELLPRQFVYKILKKLERAGVGQTTRGPEGGCRLVADLHQLSLYDLREIMEAEKMISACMQPGFQCAWQQKYGSSCTVHRHLVKIQKVLDQELRSHSLHQMLFERD